jgi:hypothetical protein
VVLLDRDAPHAAGPQQALERAAQRAGWLADLGLGRIVRTKVDLVAVVMVIVAKKASPLRVTPSWVVGLRAGAWLKFSEIQECRDRRRFGRRLVC